MDDISTMTITFRCPPELEPILPRPIPAVLGLPDWFKTMPQKAFSTVLQTEQMTVKKCPPFIDAMTFGFLIPLIADLRARTACCPGTGIFRRARSRNYSRSPIDFHDNNQVTGTPFYEEDRFLIKIRQFLDLRDAGGLLAAHHPPVQPPRLPFVTLTGLVDADSYCDNFINFPAHWRDTAFNGVLPKGTPVAQCVPVKRDSWTARFGLIEGDAVGRLQELSRAVLEETGVYRRRFRSPKR